MAGAKAEQGTDRASVTATAAKAAAKAVAATKTIGLAISPCKVPGSAKPTFEIAQDR